jgi:hypothetical protein
LVFFNGPSLHDDVNYWVQAIATGLDNAWPPGKNHWHTRIGFILPCALLLKMFGLKIWVPYVFTMLGGLLEVGLTFYTARLFVSEAAARLATWLCVFFPLNILYSSYLYVDLWSGLLGALGLLFWHIALQTDRARDYMLASLCFGLGWLFRETVIMLGPIYLALWLQAGRWRRPKLIWAVLPGLLVLLGEMLLYQFTAHNWRYRFDAIFDSKAQMLEDVASDTSFVLTPVVQLFTSHELGLFLAAGLALGILGYRRMPKPLVLWLLVGFVWFSWGTTTPAGWIPMQRDPRYLAVLTIPCLTLLAVWLSVLRQGFWRSVVIAGLIASGLLGASLDIGRVKLSAYRRFAISEYNQPATVLEPFVYFGARATQNFSPAAAQFACASDLGRTGTARSIHHLPGARVMTTTEARYLVLSVQTQPEKWKTKIKEGWHRVAEFPGDKVPVRELAAKILMKLHGVAVSVSSPPGIIVLESPAFITKSDGTLQGH